MCIPVVAECVKGVKPGRSDRDDEIGSPGSEGLEGWKPYVSTVRGDPTRAARVGEDSCARAFAELERGRSSSLGCAWLNVPNFAWTDRRDEDRNPEVILTDVERGNARSLLLAAVNCGRGWKAWRGYEARQGGAVDTRLVCQTHCGTRRCSDCAEAMRKRQCARVNGPWRMFLTLTMPRFPWTIGEAWRSIHEWIRAFLRELRREAYRRFAVSKAKTELGQERHAKRTALAWSRFKDAQKLEYAWVIERHQDGFPHVHMCINWTWIDYSFVRETWGACLGVMYADVDGRPVYDVDGQCRYLSKYVAKGVLPLDVLAIIKGRRIWACSLEAPEKEEPKYFEEFRTVTADLKTECEEREAWGAEEGWQVEAGKDGAYAIWTRPCDYDASKSIEIRESSQEEEEYISTFMKARQRTGDGREKGREESIHEAKEYLLARILRRMILDS